mmetsp:Transcript_39065/g.67622  ORF Transcript_39065/g.67622 Transcript_39065/m.67622 type:complete len:474 (+) Transcript_39065:97-1518(+)
MENCSGAASIDQCKVACTCAYIILSPRCWKIVMQQSASQNSEMHVMICGLLLVDLDVVAALLLHALGELLPVQAVLLGDGAEALLHAALHALQTTHENVSVGLLHQLPQVFRILRHLRLDVHFLAGRVLLLAGHGIVEAELIGVLGLVLRVLVVVQQRLGEGHAHEEPSQALELPSAVRIGASLVVEEQPHVRAHGRDACACSQHDDVRALILRQQHLRTRGACDQHIVAQAEIADVVRANTTVHLLVREDSAGLVRLVFADLAVGVLAFNIHDALHAQGHRLGGLVITDRRRCDRVKTDPRRGLALLVRARRDDANGLALKVRHLATVVEGHVGRLPVGVPGRLCQGLRVLHVRHHLAHVRLLGAEDVPGDLLALHDANALLLDLHSPASSHCRHRHAEHAHGRERTSEHPSLLRGRLASTQTRLRTGNGRSTRCRRRGHESLLRRVDAANRSGSHHELRRAWRHVWKGWEA